VPLRPISPRVVGLPLAIRGHSLSHMFRAAGFVHLVRIEFRSRATASLYRVSSVVCFPNGVGSTGISLSLAAVVASATLIHLTKI
jgi:hypothetical protein